MVTSHLGTHNEKRSRKAQLKLPINILQAHIIMRWIANQQEVHRDSSIISKYMQGKTMELPTKE